MFNASLITDNITSRAVAENGETTEFCLDDKPFSNICTRLYFIKNYVCLHFPTSNDFLLHLETGVHRVIEEATRNDDVVEDSDWVSTLSAHE